MRDTRKYEIVKVIDYNINEKVELTPANFWCDPVKKKDLEALRKALYDFGVPHVLAKVEWETVDSYHVGYVAYVPNKYRGLDLIEEGRQKTIELARGLIA